MSGNKGVSSSFPMPLVERLDEQVREGKFRSRAHAIKVCTARGVESMEGTVYSSIITHDTVQGGVLNE